MDFWGTVLVLFRRWYVALPTLIVCLAGTALLYRTVPVTYTSNGVIVLSIPKTGATVPSDPRLANPLSNPLLNFDFGLNMTASLLIQALNAPDVAAELGITPGSKTGYKVSNGSTNPELMMSGPFVFIEGESDNPETARQLVGRVLARTRAELVSRQMKVGAPPQTFLTATEVVAPTTPAAKRGSKARAAAAGAAFGFMISLWSAFAAESFAARRRGRRARDKPSLGLYGDAGVSAHAEALRG